jgi:hypothetical protein
VEELARRRLRGRETYMEPILRNLRRGHFARTVLAVLETGVEVGEALGLHGQVLSYFVEAEEASLRYEAVFDIFVDLCADSGSDGLFEGGEGVEGGLFG